MQGAGFFFLGCSGVLCMVCAINYTNGRCLSGSVISILTSYLKLLTYWPLASSSIVEVLIHYIYVSIVCP